MYDGGDVILIFDNSAAWQHRYLHGDAVDQVFMQENIGEILCGLADNQGTIRDVANYDPQTDTSAVLNHCQFNAFGGITSETDPNVNYRQVYTGGYFDEDTGLLYRWHRWYDAETARWMSEDWILDDTNSYRYVRNSSPNLTDPSGLQPPTKELAKKLAEKHRQHAALQEMLKHTKTWAGRKWIEAQIEYLDTEDSDLLNRRLQAIAPLRRHREISVRAQTRVDVARHKRIEAEKWEGRFLYQTTQPWNVSGQLYHLAGGHEYASGAATAANPNLSPLQRFFGALQAGMAVAPLAAFRKVPAQVTLNRLAGSAFEKQAQKYVTKELGETVIQSQVRRGSVDYFFDFLSFTGKGKNARLFINEAKNVTGKVRPEKFGTFGLGKSGKRTFNEAIIEAEKAIRRAGLDRATKESLLQQLETGARIRLIGSRSKSTVFDPKVKQRIGQSTGYITGEGFLLP